MTGRPSAGERGSALITALIMLTVMGFFLIAFQDLNKNELNFSAFARSNTQALQVAEAGIQEGVRRLNMFGANPGTTCFVNSMTTGATCAASTSSPNANTVVYQARMSSDAAVFPVLSLATVNGENRAVRIYVSAVYKTGFSDVILAPQVTFSGDASPITGDTYSATNIVFQQYSKSPQPGTGATATNLVSPQVLAATNIGTTSGAASNPGASPNPYVFECASNSVTEVAPTNCARKVDANGNTLPVNWHPLTPIGMSAADFATVINWCPGHSCNSFGVNIYQTTQSGTNVTYSPVSYAPSYWASGNYRCASYPSGPCGVLTVVTTAPFCIDSTIVQVTVPPCVGQAKYYGGVATSSQPERYMDWGLISDDNTRGQSTTFFETPSCTAPCANSGNQNGIRYVPLMPSLNVTGMACTQNFNPGANVFDKVNTGDGITCSSPPVTTINSTSVTFSGTKSNPESLVIDNAGFGTVTIQPSIVGPGNCSSNFDNYNWGMILATGDISISGNMVFKGFIFTPGNVYTSGTVTISGGVFSNDDPGLNSQVNQVDSTGTVNSCAGSGFLLTPQFYTFTQIAWEDRPGGQP